MEVKGKPAGVRRFVHPPRGAASLGVLPRRGNQPSTGELAQFGIDRTGAVPVEAKGFEPLDELIAVGRFFGQKEEEAR